MDAHVEATHLQSAAKQLQILWHKVETLNALSESENRHAVASPTTWVFNWRADSWEAGIVYSETHDFGEGVTGYCIIKLTSNVEYSHFIGYMLRGIDKCTVLATLSILDTHDKILREVYELKGEDDFTDVFCKGKHFTPTADEKARSVRADGSIRLRAVVRLFLDDAA